MTKKQLEARARKYRLMASRLYQDLNNGTAGQCGAEHQVRAAHDALCKAFMQIEREIPND